MDGMDTDRHFHWADYLVLGLFFLFNIGMGLFIGFRDRKKNSSKELLMAGGNMHWLPTALSMQASFLSAVTVLATPTEIYFFGTMYVYIALSFATSLPIAAYFYIPTYFKLNLVSVYEYLELRFNKLVRICGAANFSVMVIMYLMVVLYTPSIALAQVTDLEIWQSVLICGIVCTIYTVLGGMKATIWNDFFQMLVVYGGLIMVIAMGSSAIGGYSKVWEINKNGSRVIFNQFKVNPTLRTTFWTQVIGGTTIHASMYCSSQTVIQKFLSVGHLGKARRAVWLAVASSMAVMFLVCMIGTIIYAYYADCDPLSMNPTMRNDQLMPKFIMDLLGDYHGLPGLFLAAAFSAALSSVSGSLNALAAVFLIDFIGPGYSKYKGGAAVLSDRATSILTRVLVLIFGCITIILGTNAEKMGSLILQLSNSIFGFLGGPLLGLLTLGIFFPYVSSWGAFAGHISSLIISSWIAIGTMVNGPPAVTLKMRTDGCLNQTYTTQCCVDPSASTAAPEPEKEYFGPYKLSNMYYGLISILVSVTVASLVSLITGRAKNTQKKLIFDCSKNCCCYCPPGCKECMHCGAVIEDIEDNEDKPVQIGVVLNGTFSDLVNPDPGNSNSSLAEQDSNSQETQNAELFQEVRENNGGIVNQGMDDDVDSTL